MPVWAWVLIAIAAAAALGYLVYRAVTKQRLQRRFGEEYDRTVEDRGDPRAAQADLREREKRRKGLNIVPLSDASRTRSTQRWQDIQSRFVDMPAEAVREADALIVNVMRERGYPVDDFDQRAADVSVDHPNVVTHYRDAHATLDRGSQASTEQMRDATVHYRALFEELVQGGTEEERRVS